MAGPDNDNTTGDVVRLTQGEWERRAAVAEEAAALLAGAAATMQDIASSNSFGDCVEGVGMHSALQDALANCATAVTRLSQSASATSASCLSASTSLTSADADGSRTLSS